MVLQQIIPTEKAGKDKEGNPKTYYNVAPKKDLEYDNHIVITKAMDAPMKEFEKDFGQGPKKSYLWLVTYGDKDVSFFLNAKQNERFMAVGGVDDQVIIKKFKNSFVNSKTGLEMLYADLEFTLAQ